MVNPNRFYTYAYLRENKTPYYIGKGQGNRVYRKHHKGINVPKNKSKIILLKQNLTEEEAFKHEKYMIAVFGRKDLGTGILHNKTDGGDGPSGIIPWNKGKTGIYSEETISKMKISLSLVLSGENNPMYGKIGEQHPAYGYRHNKDVLQMFSDRQKGEKNHMYGRVGENNPNYGSKRNEETKKKMSERQIGEKNHMYGKKSWNSGKSVMMWITDGVESRYVFKECDIPNGWRRGRTFTRNTNK